MKPRRLVAILAVLATACAGGDSADTAVDDPTTTPTTTTTSTTTTATIAPTTTTTQSISHDFELTETHVIDDVGYAIDYPEGWHAGTRGTLTDSGTVPEDGIVTNISQLERDHERNFNGFAPPQGFQIIMDIRDTDTMSDEYELPSDPSLEELLQFNIDFFSLIEPEVSETEIFGQPVLCATVATKNKCGGFIGENMFLVSVKGPTPEKFEEALVIWDDMRQSIERLEGE